MTDELIEASLRKAPSVPDKPIWFPDPAFFFPVN
jgi:hypothetical protein